jgi:NADH:ubiquinone oxidoreductase subunit H
MSLIQYGLLINTSFAQLIICTIIKLICVLIAVAYFTIAERKAMAAIQRRKGPNVVGF